MTGAEGAFIWETDHLTARAISMAGLADRLFGPAFGLNRPVVNMTGIDGVYDFTLDWATDAVPSSGQPAPSIFTAWQEQLGLRLEARKMPFRILIVDYAERVPTEN